MWSDLAIGLAIFFVLEGILPFLTPGGYRAAMRELSRQDDRTLRLVGLSSMIGGVLLLSWLR